MNSKEKQLTREQTKQRAMSLYLISPDKTLEEIATLANCTRQTLSKMIKEGEWDKMRDTIHLTPQRRIYNMYKELAAIDAVIQKREPAEQWANKDEATARHKTVQTIKELQTSLGIPVITQVMMLFVDDIKIFDKDLAIKVADFVTGFLQRQSEKEMLK